MFSVASIKGYGTQATSPVSPMNVRLGVCENVSQMLGPRPSTAADPSIWYAAVAAPQTNSGGNRLARASTDSAADVPAGLAGAAPSGTYAARGAGSVARRSKKAPCRIRAMSAIR